MSGEPEVRAGGGGEGAEVRCLACGHLASLHTIATGRLDTGCAVCEAIGKHPARICRIGQGFLLTPREATP